MKPLFSNPGLGILEGFCLSEILFAFDYDGTLARIVTDPQFAVMTDSTRELLRRLSQLVPVAVISGRSRDDVCRLLGLDLPYIIGNHGLEGLPNGNRSFDEWEKNSASWIEILKKEILGLQGVWIEDKKYSLAIHYRSSRQKRTARETILRIADELRPSPRVILGKHVVNLVSADSPHKGNALLEILAHSQRKSAIYIGDDDTDEDIFALPQNGILTARVGKKTDSNAQFYLKRQVEIDRLLKMMIRWRESLLLQRGKRSA